MADEANIDNLQEAGASEGSLSPGGGTAAGDIKTKTIADIVSALGSMSHEDINHFAASLRQSVEAGRQAGGAHTANLASIKSSGALKEAVRDDLKKIFGKEDTLSEGFVDSATTLFEAAVTSRVAVEIEGIEEEFEDRLNEAREDFVTKSTERLDSYLDYFATQFMEDNRVAVEGGIRQELAESFLEGIRDLFVEHNVTIETDKLDVVAALEAKVTDLTEQLNNQVDENARVAAEIEAREISNVVNTVSEGMIEADKERLKTIAENVDYSDVADFQAKLVSIKDTLFAPASLTESKDTNGLVLEEVTPLEEEVTAKPAAKAPADSQMARVLAEISRQAKAR